MVARWRNLSLALALAILVLGAVFLIQQKRQQLDSVPEYGQRPRPVTVTAAEKGDLLLTKDYLAVVEPGQEARIASRVQAEVQEILVQEGQKVESGQELMRLDSQEIQHRLQEVQARVLQTQAELEAHKATTLYLESSLAFWQREKKRQQNLLEQQVISPSEAEKTAERAAEAQGRLQAARSESQALNHHIEDLKHQKKEIQTRLDYHTLKSPGAGVVAETLTDPGDMAAPDRILLRIQDLSRLKLAFDVPQQDLPQISTGLQCTFQVEDRTRKARINLMHPALGEHRMQRAEVWLHKEQRQGLRPGSYQPVTVLVKKLQDKTLVPRTALIPSPAGQKHVFTVSQERLQATEVEVLGSGKDRAAVQGIQPGKKVVQNTFLGWSRLSSGEKVEPVQ